MLYGHLPTVGEMNHKGAERLCGAEITQSAIVIRISAPEDKRLATPRPCDPTTSSSRPFYLWVLETGGKHAPWLSGSRPRRRCLGWGRAG